jgi:hypothetical protein
MYTQSDTLDPSLFVDSPPEFLVCAVCKEVLPADPVESSHLPCGHMFCNNDIARVDGRCPTCRSFFGFSNPIKSLTHPSLFVQRGILLELRVKCLHEDCEDVVTHEDLYNHIKNCTHPYTCVCGFSLSSKFKNFHSCEDRSLAALGMSVPFNSSDNLWKKSLLRNYTGRPDVIEALLDYGVNVNMCIIMNGKEERATTLHAAAGVSPVTTELLIQRGADINVITKDGWTPLMYAAVANNFKCAELLIKSGVSVNVSNEDGNTALHYFASFSNEVACRTITEHGACLRKRNKRGKFPADLTDSRGIKNASLLHICQHCSSRVTNRRVL